MNITVHPFDALAPDALAHSNVATSTADETSPRGNGVGAVLVVDDEPASVELLRITLGMDYQVYTATNGASALALLAQHAEIAVAIIDQRMPGMSGTELIQKTIAPYPQLVRIILTGYTDIDSLIDAINAGRVFRYLTKPWTKEELLATVRQGLDVHRLAMDNIRLQQELRDANARLRVENAVLRREVKARHRFAEIIGCSPTLERTLALVERVVATDITVLIGGETGTGKELIARAIHYNGPRADKPFLSVSCADFSGDMLSSELFGHKRGSFTGAIEDRQGLFKAADGGTVFLDEVGECAESVQTRLLRVLDQGEIRRLGDDKPTKVDVRIIAATNRNLEEAVEAGRFRKDLFFRLSVFPVVVPPLRQRRDDIPILAQHFLDALMRESSKQVHGFTTDALALLSAHDFPGNVRELENEVARAFTLADPEGFITPDLLSDKFAALTPLLPGSEGMLRAAVDQFEAQFIREALTRNTGNQTRTADELGLSRRGFIDKLRKYGIGRS